MTISRQTFFIGLFCKTDVLNCQDLKLGIGVEVNHNPNDFAGCHVRPSGFAVGLSAVDGG